MNALEFEEEMVKGKNEFVILDDLVLDVSQFKDSHPGGKFLLERMRGRDVSKFFHGGYSLEPTQGSENHAHSNYARTIVNSLIVARYVAKRTTAVMSIKESYPIKEIQASGKKTVQTFVMEPRGQALS